MSRLVYCVKTWLSPRVSVSQSRLDENQQQMEQDVSVTLNKVRAEAVEKIMKLKKKYGCTNDDDDLTLTQLKVHSKKNQRV